MTVNSLSYPTLGYIQYIQSSYHQKNYEYSFGNEEVNRYLKSDDSKRARPEKPIQTNSSQPE